MITSSPHTHTTFVDGKSSPEQMVLRAIECGFESMGFSEHGVQPFDFDYSMSPDTERMYIKEVEFLKEKYRENLRIYLGVERDLFSTSDRANYDYVIGSMHYIQQDDIMVPLDGPGDKIHQLIERVFGGDGYAYAETYFDRFAGYIESYRPNIIGHFDLIVKTNGHGWLIDQRHERYQAAARGALGRMIHSGALLEVNTGAMARGYMTMPYPMRDMLECWRALGGRVILSSDCHDAKLLDYGYGDALQLIREAGYRSAWALNPLEGELFVEYPL